MFTQRLWVDEWCCQYHALRAIESTVRAEVVYAEREPSLDVPSQPAFAFTVWFEPFPWITPRLRDKEPE